MRPGRRRVVASPASRGRPRRRPSEQLVASPRGTNTHRQLVSWTTRGRAVSGRNIGPRKAETAAEAHQIVQERTFTMVTENIFGSVQYGDVKVRYAPAPEAGGYYYPPGGSHETEESLQIAPPEALPTPQPQEPGAGQRKRREFIQDTRKDQSYWDRRRRNNEAAKRSREKRRFNDMILETRVAELTKDNYLLRAQLNTIRDKFGIVGENHIDVEQVLAQLPSMDRILGFSKRPKPLAAASLLQLSSAAATAFPLGAAAGASGATRQFRPVTPPSAPAALPGREAAPFVYRQQSLLELRRPEAPAAEPWRPRSADSDRLTPEFGAAVNLTKPAAERPVAGPGSPGAEQRSLPLKLRHKTRLGEWAQPPPAVKEEPHDSASSGDERDSGLSDRSAGSDDAAASPANKRRRSSAAEPAPAPAPSGGQIRSELERLSMEVASLRSLLSRTDATADGGAGSSSGASA